MPAVALAVGAQVILKLVLCLALQRDLPVGAGVRVTGLLPVPNPLTVDGAQRVVHAGQSGQPLVPYFQACLLLLSDPTSLCLVTHYMNYVRTVLVSFLGVGSA